MKVLRAVNEYTEALLLLDKYDHQALEKPDGAVPVYKITYEDCKEMVGKMRDSFDTDVFGVEKESRHNCRYYSGSLSECFWRGCVSIYRRKVLIKQGLPTLTLLYHNPPQQNA